MKYYTEELSKKFFNLERSR